MSEAKSIYILVGSHRLVKPSQQDCVMEAGSLQVEELHLDAIKLKIIINGDPFITFAPRGGEGRKKWPILRATVLIGCVKMRTRGEGVQNAKKFCERNKWMPPEKMFEWFLNNF